MRRPAVSKGRSLLAICSMPVNFSRQTHLVIATAFVLIFILLRPYSSHAKACRIENFETTDFVICDVPRERLYQLQLFWKNNDGQPYRDFSELASALEHTDKHLVFAFNAGMYDTDFTPIGLHVENGTELRPVKSPRIVARSGSVPNFYKEPNGIFYVDESRAGILPTNKYIKHPPKAKYATQSEPILVINGSINPIFIVNSTDRTYRSGVGVCEGDRVRFAISNDPVNFHQFARLFRDHLLCPNALFLDGGGGAGLYTPSLTRNDNSWHGGYGPIFGFIE